MSNENKSRTLVNIIGIPLLVSAIYFGSLYFSMLIYLAIFIGILEFDKICKGKGIYIQLTSVFISFILIIANLFRFINIELLFMIFIFIAICEIFRNKDFRNRTYL